MYIYIYIRTRGALFPEEAFLTLAYAQIFAYRAITHAIY